MNTINKEILSPIQIDVRNNNHPVRDEVKRICGITYDINVSFEEDTATLKSFGHVPGIVAILCTFRKDGEVLAFGRSLSIFTKNSKWMERTIGAAFNGSFMSAANSAVKVLETLRLSSSSSSAHTKPNGESASSKQIMFLQRLLPKISVAPKRQELAKALSDGSRTKSEAGAWIKSILG